MNLKVGQTLQVKTHSLSHEGLGVAKVDDFTIFILGMMDQEEGIVQITKLHKTYGQATMVSLLEVNPCRQTPICPIFDACGGCEIMHFKYPYQLRFKKQMVMQTMRRLGGFANLEINDVIGMDDPYSYRNKVQVPFGMQKNKAIMGFYKKKSHEIIPFEQCYIQTDVSTRILHNIRDFLNKHKISAYNEVSHTGLVRHALIRNNDSGQYMVILVLTSKKLPMKALFVEELTKHFPEISSIIVNINPRKTNVILGDECLILHGQDRLESNICGLKFVIHHNSFLQINHEQSSKLYTYVMEKLQLKKTDVVVDAYCGVGTMALLAAKQAKYVHGIEIVPEAIQNAKDNQILNQINNAQFICGKSEVELDSIHDTIDAIILDPPRKGCDPALLDAIIKRNIAKIAYVSCNPATLARDLQHLASHYSFDTIQPFDFFPQTSHVEVVCFLEKKQ